MPEHQWQLTRVRIDCGGFDIDNLDLLDENSLEFVKCKKYAGLWTIIQRSTTAPVPWTASDEMFSVNEIQAKLPKWEKTYRFVLRSKTYPIKNDKQIRDGERLIPMNTRSS